MSVFQRIKMKKHNFGHFIVIAFVLLVGFSVAVYFLKHPVVKISKDSPAVITEKPSTNGEGNSNSEQKSTTTNSGISSNSTTQTNMPATGQSDILFSVFLLSVFSFVIAKYLQSLVGVWRYF